MPSLGFPNNFRHPHSRLGPLSALHDNLRQGHYLLESEDIALFGCFSSTNLIPPVNIPLLTSVDAKLCAARRKHITEIRENQSGPC